MPRVDHQPKWEPADLPVDVAGNTRPGFVCVHELENGNGQCGGNVFEIESEVSKLPHGCIVEGAEWRAHKQALIDQMPVVIDREAIEKLAGKTLPLVTEDGMVIGEGMLVVDDAGLRFEARIGPPPKQINVTFNMPPSSVA